MLYYALVFLSFFQSVIGFTMMSSSVMSFKEPMKKRIIVGLIVMISGISFLSYSLSTQAVSYVENFAILIILVIELSWFLICSKDPFFVSLFNFLTFVNIYVSISYISDTLSRNLNGSIFVGGRILIRLVIYLATLPILYKFVRPHFRRLVDALDKEWRASVLVPFMFLLMQIMVLYYPAPYWHWENRTWSRIIIVTVYMLFLAVYYLLYVQANGIVEKYALEKQQLIMAQQEKLWKSELARQKASTRLASQQRHDMHHHNTVIMSLLQKGQTQELKIYLKKFDRALNAHNEHSFTSNPIANSILTFYAIRGQEEGIKMKYNISMPEDIRIDNVDLTCILGNTLENALEGTLRLGENVKKEISLTAKYIDKRLRIQVENNCLTDIEFENDLPITQKQGGGTGTKSITYTVDRYDGTVGFSAVDGVFSTQIVLNLD